jgi:hypothetical protein
MSGPEASPDLTMGAIVKVDEENSGRTGIRREKVITYQFKRPLNDESKQSLTKIRRILIRSHSKPRTCEPFYYDQ